MIGPIVRALRICVDVFDRLGVDYALMGGVAVRAYSLPRPTFDVDFTLAIPRDRLSELFAEFDAAGYTVPEIYRSGWVDAVAGMPVVKVRMEVGDRGVDIDMFLAESAFQHSIMDRRRKDVVDEQVAWIVSPEDLVLLKLVAARPRDLIDVADILFVQGELDGDYLRHWADRLGVRQALDHALRDAADSAGRP